jgi:hypothetical protein
MPCTVKVGDRSVLFAAGIFAGVATANLRVRFSLDAGALEDDNQVTVTDDAALAEGAVYTFLDFRGRASTLNELRNLNDICTN